MSVDLFGQVFEFRRFLNGVTLGGDGKCFKMVGKRRELGNGPLADALKYFHRLDSLSVTHHRHNQGFTVVARIARQRQPVTVETAVSSSATVYLFAPGPGRLARRSFAPSLTGVFL